MGFPTVPWDGLWEEDQGKWESPLVGWSHLIWAAHEDQTIGGKRPDHEWEETRSH